MDRGDYEKARLSSWRAQQWSMIGIVTGILLYMSGAVIFIVIFVIDVLQGEDSNYAGV